MFEFYIYIGKYLKQSFNLCFYYKDKLCLIEKGEIYLILLLLSNLIIAGTRLYNVDDHINTTLYLHAFVIYIHGSYDT